MCGIVGVAATSEIGRPKWLERGCEALAYRGPDDCGVFWSEDNRVGFGHRRLSIVDLSFAGHQPMQTRDGRLTIVFNGEIYNFRALRDELKNIGHEFQSHTDTEVILAAYRQWGAQCLQRLEGMFAFAIHNLDARTVFLARDRAGEKPLYYMHAGGELRFASELKALMADTTLDRRINIEAFDCYLTMGYVPGERCILEGMNKLPAAHALLFDYSAGTAKLWRYWDLPQFDPACDAVSDEEHLDKLEVLMEAAVQRQLVADVPVAVLLSGGVDSSLVTAFAARSGRPKTFTVGFRRFAEYNESEHAHLIARHFGTEHVDFEADDVNHEILPLLARQFDEPMIDSSMIPTFLLTRQVARSCKVALGGDGGDELFGGYYSASRMATLQQRGSALPLNIRRGIAIAAMAVLPIGSKGRQFLTMLGHDFASELPLFSPQFDRVSRKRLLLGFARSSFVAEDIRQSRIPAAVDAVQRICRFDFENYLAEDILVKVDRASMANSVEVRSPFLDISLVEFAFREVPSRLKATPSQRKIILRRLASRVLPPEFETDRKQGFGIPLATWLSKGAWRSFFEQVLLDTETPFNRRDVQRLLRVVKTNRRVKELLFGLTLFELWRREYGAVF